MRCSCHKQVNHLGNRCKNSESSKVCPLRSGPTSTPQSSHTSSISSTGSTPWTEFVLEFEEHVYKGKRSRKPVSLTTAALCHHYHHKAGASTTCRKQTLTSVRVMSELMLLSTEWAKGRDSSPPHCWAAVIQPRSERLCMMNSLSKTYLCTISVKIYSSYHHLSMSFGVIFAYFKDKQ